MDRPFYSVTFGTKNTWDEWALMPVKEGRIEFVTPDVKQSYIDIPGSDGELDLSDVLTGYPTYENRKGTLKFRFFDNGVPSRARFTQLKNYLHGKTMKAVIEDDPSHYYEGRFMVGELTFSKRGNWGEVEISYNVQPYKVELTSTGEDWLWNPFNFETGIIRDYQNIYVPGLLDVPVIGSAKPTVPKITVASENGMTLTFENSIYILSEGVNVIPTVVLHDQEYTLRFVGSGTVTIDMTVGEL